MAPSARFHPAGVGCLQGQAQPTCFQEAQRVHWLPSGQLGSHWQGAPCIHGLAQAQHPGSAQGVCREGQVGMGQNCTSPRSDTQMAS